MDDCIDTLEKRVLLGELGNDLSVVGQVGSNKFSGNISLGGCWGDLINFDVSGYSIPDVIYLRL
jgi:hypothetical protein